MKMALEIRILPARCTCGQRLGKYQYDIESRIENGETIDRICNSMGFKRICCRSNVYNPIVMGLNDANSSRIINEVTVQTPQVNPSPSIRKIVDSSFGTVSSKEEIHEYESNQKDPILTAGPIVRFDGISELS